MCDSQTGMRFEIENAQDVKNVIEVLCPDEVLEMTDKDGQTFSVQKCRESENGFAIRIGAFSTYCSDIQVWTDSVLRFRNDDVLVGSLGGIGDMTFAIRSLEGRNGTRVHED